MLFDNKSPMAIQEQIQILVLWQEQCRLISVTMDDTLSSIIESIVRIYDLPNVDYLNDYQIQYHDRHHGRYIDLYSETIDKFKVNLEECLKSSEKTKEECFKIVAKSISTIHNLDGSVNIATNIFKKDVDSKQHSTGDKVYTEIGNNEECPMQEASVEFDSTIHRTCQDTHNHGQQKQCKSSDVDEPYSIESDASSSISENNHAYKLHFIRDLAIAQRSQFESDVFPKVGKSDKRPPVSGVRLRASSTSSTNIHNREYPLIQFHIPVDKNDGTWLLYLYILTEADRNNVHYIHASKGIFDNNKNVEDNKSQITSSKLANPKVIELTKDMVACGTYEILEKVCNMKELPTLKRAALRRLPSIGSKIMHTGVALLATHTMMNLNFDSEKYHLGCMLVHKQTVHAICISSMTVAKTRRKRTTDSATQDGSKQCDKKLKEN